MKNNRKSQAAMEFLMTYGWAILAAIIAIGVLAYFGVFNPGRLAGPAGLVSPPFNLDDFNIVDGATNDTITMIITQNLGSSVVLSNTTIDAANATDIDGFAIILPNGNACNIASIGDVIHPTAPAPWISGSQVTITASCAPGEWASGDGVRADITIRYKKGGTGLLQVSQGNVRGPSQ